MEDSGALQKLMKTAMRKFKQMRIIRKKVNMFGFLPDDILVDILKRLPDAFLRYKAKYVCRQWFDIITNRIVLHHASFILQKPNGIYKKHYLDIREEGQGLEVKEQYLDSYLSEYQIYTIRSWCNEIVLTSDSMYMYVDNLITKRGSRLPNCTSCVESDSCQCQGALSYDRSKGVYKVLHVHMGPPMQCHILILKRDICYYTLRLKWKKIEVPDYMSKGMSSWFHPVSVQGKYFHWNVHKYLVSMDMVKEKFLKLHLPISSGDCITNHHSVYEMGGFLHLIVEVKWGKADIWILRDFRRMEWEKLQSLTFLDGCFNIRQIFSVINKRYIIFKKNGSNNIMYSYDLKYGVVKEVNINIEVGVSYVVHTSAPRFI